MPVIPGRCAASSPESITRDQDAMWDCPLRHLGYLGRNYRGRVVHDVSSRCEPTIAMDKKIADRHRRDFDVDHIFSCAVSHSPVSTLQYPGRFDDPNLVGRGLFVRLEISVWLHPLFAAIFTAAIFRTHLRLGAVARRRRGVPVAKERLIRLHQARRGFAWRPHSDEAGAALHQRHAGGAAAIDGFRRGWRFVRVEPEYRHKTLA